MVVCWPHMMCVSPILLLSPRDRLVRLTSTPSLFSFAKSIKHWQRFIQFAIICTAAARCGFLFFVPAAAISMNRSFVVFVVMSILFHFMYLVFLPLFLPPNHSINRSTQIAELTVYSLDLCARIVSSLFVVSRAPYCSLYCLPCHLEMCQ